MTGSDRCSPCLECGFELYAPVAALTVSDVGLYSDARYPGRLIVKLREHHEHLDAVPSELAAAFLRDVQHCARVLRAVDGIARVNVAVLGNKVPHVHTHVVPRRPGEHNFHRSPWEDALPREALSEADFSAWRAFLDSGLTSPPQDVLQSSTHPTGSN